MHTLQEPISENVRGRPQRFCSDRCRQAHRKIAATGENGLIYRTGRLKPKSGSEGIEVAAKFRPKNASPKADLPLKCERVNCERVNDATFKITNGEFANTPASHGQWGGYRTTKALAWIIKLESNAWVARCGDQICNPTSFNKAKSQALAMARGAVGDYFVENPIRELNGLQERLVDRDEAASE